MMPIYFKRNQSLTGATLYVIPLLALVVYVYANEIQHRNWKGVAAGLALYVVHWFCEIINALIQHFSGHALWMVSTGQDLSDEGTP